MSARSARRASSDSVVTSPAVTVGGSASMCVGGGRGRDAGCGVAPQEVHASAMHAASASGFMSAHSLVVALGLRLGLRGAGVGACVGVASGAVVVAGLALAGGIRQGLDARREDLFVQLLEGVV